MIAEDLVGGLDPKKGFRVLVVMLDKMANGILQLQCAAVDFRAEFVFRLTPRTSARLGSAMKPKWG